MTPQSTTQRGYGNTHAARRKQLLYNHEDGTECDYCGRPMHRDPAKNFDGAPLNADHWETDKTHLARRLIHDQCNKKMNSAAKWVEHGPEWYAKHGQADPAHVSDTDPLDWPHGRTITWT